jgi:hypothetical protein
MQGGEKNGVDRDQHERGNADRQNHFDQRERANVI